MIRNSTKQFRQKYQPSQHKFIQSSNTIGRRSRDNSVSDLSLKTQPVLSKSNSIKKIQSSSSRFKKQLEKDKDTFRTEHSQSQMKKNYRFSHDIQHLLNIKGAQPSKNMKLSSLKKNILKQTKKQTKNPRQFIENLTKNQIFYCCDCYQYVFEIEKNRHYPSCKDKINQETKSSEEIILMGIEKLRRIVLLSQYSRVRQEQVRKLYEQVENSQISRLAQIEFNEHQLFFTVQEITEAFAFTYDRLLKGKKYQRSHYLNCF